MQMAHLSARPLSVMTAVNFSELKISNNPAETLVAFCIGSGIGVSIYDPHTMVGGLLNFVLPDSATMLPERVKRFPCMFADTGMLALLAALNDIGANMATIKVVIAGGAQILDQTSEFDIGIKNYRAITSILSRKNLNIHHEAIGGIAKRTLSLDIGSGFSIINTLGLGEVKV